MTFLVATRPAVLLLAVGSAVHAALLPTPPVLHASRCHTHLGSMPLPLIAAPSLLSEPARKCRGAVIMAAAEDGERATSAGSKGAEAQESESADAEIVDDAAGEETATAPAPAPAADEEEDDLLSSPAFLKQKLKVLEGELEAVQAETEEVAAQIEASREEWAQKRERLELDFENYKARHFNQTLEAQLEAKAKLISDLLPVLDNFERARQAIKPEGEVQEQTNARYQKMLEQLMESLQAQGLEKIPTVGEEFDYNLHNAIQQMPSDEYEEGYVCAELQPGYTFSGKLVRPAYVIVSSG